MLRPDNGEAVDSTATGPLWQRASFLQPGDYACLSELVVAMEHTVKEGRELLKKCHPKLVKVKEMKELLEDFSDDEAPNRLQEREAKKLVNAFYPVAECKAQKVYGSSKSSQGSEPGAEDEEEDEGKPPVYLRGTVSSVSSGGAVSSQPAFSVVVLTCALAKQLLKEHDEMVGTAMVDQQ